MDRPTARRRRHARSANSVTVAELQAKASPAELSAIQARVAAEATGRPGPASFADTAVDATGPVWPAAAPYRPPAGQVDATTEPVRSEDIAEEPRTSNRLSRTIALTVTAIVACGGVTAFAVLDGHRPQRLSPSVPVSQPTVLAGPALTQPDPLIQQLTDGTVKGGAAHPFGSAPQGEPPGDPVDDEVAARVVDDFYDYAGPLEHRQKAFDLLAPTMRTDGWTAFDSGWRGTREAELARWRPDERGALRAWVSIERLDGTLLWLIARIYVRSVRVDGIARPRIVGIELLSAYRG